MANPTPTIRHIVGVVRLEGRRGCTVAYLMEKTGGTRQGIEKALEMQIQAGLIEQTGGTYRIREGE